MLVQIVLPSMLDTGQSAVLIERLSTAPRNRDWLALTPSYRGCGTGLFFHAVKISYSLGMLGRVQLVAIAHEDFYLNLGLVKTGKMHDGDFYYELSVSEAYSLLQKQGHFDD